MSRCLCSVVLWAALIGSSSMPMTLAQTSGSARLSLDQCLRTALENNLDLVSARKDPAVARESVESSRSPFDVTFGAGTSYNDGDFNSSITQSGAAGTDGLSQNQDLGASVSASQLLRFGADYTATYSYADNSSLRRSFFADTNSVNQTANDTTSASLKLDFSMPLLGGLGKEVNTLDLLLAQSGVSLSKEDLRLVAMTTLQQVEDAYWDVLASRAALRISRLALKRAEDLLELNRKKVDVGTLAPIEITEAEAGVASQVEAVIVAETSLENAEDTLLELLATPEDSVMWSQSLEPTDTPEFSPVTVDVAETIATALERRPEMIRARQALRDDELSERVARRGTRHRLDLDASVTPYLDSENDEQVTLGVTSPVPLTGSTMTKSDGTDWTVSLNYSFPIRNRAAQASYRTASINTSKSVLSVQKQEQSIRVELRKAVRNVESGIQRVEAARKNVELQREKLNAEEKKFDNGMSTSFQVLEFQNDLADAERREVDARLDYVKSLTALELAKGTLLEARGLTISE